MFLFRALLAVSSLITLVVGNLIPFILSSPNAYSLPVSTAASSHWITERMINAYTTYTGDGTMSAGWPAQSAWVSSFETMFNDNKAIIAISCAQYGQPENSADEIKALHDSIEQVAVETDVDSRFILAILMQESKGCVRTPTTKWDHRNPGLMQDHDGEATCNENGVKDPCPSDIIKQMIRDGVAGTPRGDGLKQCLAKSGASDESKYYKAARIYNSGSIDQSGDLGKGGSTHCYVSDVANRLTGWVSGAPSPCCLGSGCTTTPTTPSVSPSASKSSGGWSCSYTGTGVCPAISSPPGTPAPSATTQCWQWYTVQSGDYCQILEQKFGISMAQLQKWNPNLDSGCSNLWLGYDYCVRGP